MQIIFNVLLFFFAFSPSIVKMARSNKFIVKEPLHHVECDDDIVYSKNELKSSTLKACKRLDYSEFCHKNTNCETIKKHFPKSYSGLGKDLVNVQLYEHLLRPKKKSGKLIEIFPTPSL